MFKKIAVIATASVLLGGCTLLDGLKPGDAAKDEKKMAPIESSVPVMSPDTSLEAIPSTSSSSDITSLETDINSTQILEEDFSDLN